MSRQNFIHDGAAAQVELISYFLGSIHNTHVIDIHFQKMHDVQQEEQGSVAHQGQEQGVALDEVNVFLDYFISLVS